MLYQVEARVFNEVLWLYMTWPGTLNNASAILSIFNAKLVSGACRSSGRRPVNVAGQTSKATHLQCLRTLMPVQSPCHSLCMSRWAVILLLQKCIPAVLNCGENVAVHL